MGGHPLTSAAAVPHLAAESLPRCPIAIAPPYDATLHSIALKRAAPFSPRQGRDDVAAAVSLRSNNPCSPPFDFFAHLTRILHKQNRLQSIKGKTVNQKAMMMMMHLGQLLARRGWLARGIIPFRQNLIGFQGFSTAERSRTCDVVWCNNIGQLLS